VSGVTSLYWGIVVCSHPICETERKFYITVGTFAVFFGGLASILMTPLFANYRFFSMVGIVVLGYYACSILWMMMTNKETGGIRHCAITASLIVGGLLVFHQATSTFYDAVVGDKVEAVSTTVSSTVDKTADTFQKHIRPFWKVTEVGFSVQVDRNLLAHFSDCDMRFVENRFRDLARFMGNDKRDRQFDSLYIGGHLTKEDGDFVLISRDNGGKKFISLGLIVPERGGKYISQPGIGIQNPTKIVLTLTGESLRFASNGFDITIDQNGEIETKTMPYWND